MSRSKPLWRMLPWNAPESQRVEKENRAVRSCHSEAKLPSNGDTVSGNLLDLLIKSVDLTVIRAKRDNRTNQRNCFVSKQFPHGSRSSSSSHTVGQASVTPNSCAGLRLTRGTGRC